MDAEERIGDPEELRRLLDHADFAIPFELRHRKPRDQVGARCGSVVTGASHPRNAAAAATFSISRALACADNPKRLRPAATGLLRRCRVDFRHPRGGAALLCRDRVSSVTS